MMKLKDWFLMGLVGGAGWILSVTLISELLWKVMGV